MSDNNKHPLQDIVDRIKTQDNRCTESPIFLLQIKKRDVGYDPNYCDGDTVWIDMESGDYQETNADAEGSIEFGYRDRWETVMFAFTEHGIIDYMEANGHNVLRRAHNGEYQIYADSLFRCREMIRIREYLLSIDMSAAEESQKGEE